jgi:sterol desaturase/sphingolipid hydroxylase (fatty acid hydroxylase superfamily)
MIYILIAALGFVAWTLTEYSLHRFLGHEAKFKNLFKMEHMAHHANKDYFAPAWMKLIVATAIGTGMYFTLNLVFSFEITVVFTGAFISSFLGYEFYHYYLHVVPPRTRLGKELRKHHFYHHFTNPMLNHGVTTTFWDKVFGTYKKTDVVQVHKNFAMDWLKQNQDYYKSDYVVKETTPFT